MNNCYQNCQIFQKIFSKFYKILTLSVESYQMLPPDKIFSAPYLFVLSTGRSGTKLLTFLLNKSSKLSVYHSPLNQLEYVSSIALTKGATLEEQKYAILASRFELYFLESSRSEKIYVETNNRITPFADALADLLPNSKFIHLVRDPASYVISGMRRNYYNDNIIQYQRLDFGSDDYWSNLTRLEKIAFEWNFINDRIEKFKASISNDRIFTIKSEDLFSQPSVIRDIFNFINIDLPKDFTNLKLTTSLISKPKNSQKTGDFPPFYLWSESDKHSFRKIASLSSYYGYMY